MRDISLAATLVLASLAAGCGQPGSAAPDEGDATSTASAPRSPGSAATPAGNTSLGAGAAATAATGERTRELVNPADETMVLLYFDLAGLAPAFDAWVERSFAVTRARPADKAARRAEGLAAFEAAYAAVHDVGLLRLSMRADLSDYDPAYGEFTIRALSPSSIVKFEAHEHQISLRFANGLAAQVWTVPQAQAQRVLDQLGYGQARLDVLLRIDDVQPATKGGTIVTEVLGYELRDDARGTVLARVQVTRS